MEEMVGLKEEEGGVVGKRVVWWGERFVFWGKEGDVVGDE